MALCVCEALGESHHHTSAATSAIELVSTGEPSAATPSPKPQASQTYACSTRTHTRAATSTHTQ